MSNESKTALITGAAGALGSATVTHLLEQGFQVVALERDVQQLHQRFGEANARLLSLACDVTVAASGRAACEHAMQRFGRIDVLCNIAGGFSMGSAIAPDAIAQYEQLMELNAGAVFKMMHGVIPMMIQQGGGSIVNIGAQSALAGQAQMAAYAASKSAVIRMTESFAAEFRPQGVRVNCILPRMIDTPRNRADMPDADFSQWTAPEKIAQVIGYLASDLAAAVNGASIAV